MPDFSQEASKVASSLRTKARALLARHLIHGRLSRPPRPCGPLSTNLAMMWWKECPQVLRDWPQFSRYYLIRIIVAKSPQVGCFWSFKTDSARLIEINGHNKRHNPGSEKDIRWTYSLFSWWVAQLHYLKQKLKSVPRRTILQII